MILQLGVAEQVTNPQISLLQAAELICEVNVRLELAD